MAETKTGKSFALVGSATGASVLTGLLAGAIGMGIAQESSSYGWWLFVLLPIAMGISAALVVNWDQTREGGYGFITSGAVFLLAGFVILIVGFEGLICLFMAAPLYFPLHWVGYFCMREWLKSKRDSQRGAMVTAVPLIALAGFAFARQTPAAEVRTQSTAMEIDATPEEIWPLLFRMEAIPQPPELPFRVGVAYPVAIRSAGEYVGAARQCVLSTGTMPEVVEISEPARRLKFRVLETPASMREINPFHDVRPKHLHGFYTVRWGEFRLEPLPGGRTRVTGTSEYALRIYPVIYWDLWTDRIVDGIHRSVIGEVKRRVEAERERKRRGSA